MVIQFDEQIFLDKYKELTPKEGFVESQNIIDNLLYWKFWKFSKIIEESIQKESFLGNYKNKKNKKNYNGFGKKQNYPKTRAVTFLNKDTGKVDAIKKDINTNLNKMTHKNSNIIFLEILKIYEQNLEIFDYHNFVDNIFDKAVTQPIYCPLYVKLFIIMEKKYNTLSEIEDNKFSKLILSKCELFKSMIDDFSQKMMTF